MLNCVPLLGIEYTLIVPTRSSYSWRPDPRLCNIVHVREEKRDHTWQLEGVQGSTSKPIYDHQRQMRCSLRRHHLRHGSCICSSSRIARQPETETDAVCMHPRYTSRLQTEGESKACNRKHGRASGPQKAHGGTCGARRAVRRHRVGATPETASEGLSFH